MDTTPGSFGEWVKYRRRTLDLSQKELAHRAGCSLTALQKIEGDERRPSRQLAGRLIDFLDVPPEQRPLLLKIARGERMMETLLPRLSLSGPRNWNQSRRVFRRPPRCWWGAKKN